MRQTVGKVGRESLFFFRDVSQIIVYGREGKKTRPIRAMEAIPTGNHREDELNKDMKVNLGATCSVDLGDVDLVGSEVDVEDVVMGSELVGAAVEELESS